MSASSPTRRCLHPYVVMGAAAILPGIGQLLNHQPTRALTFIFFILMLGAATYHLTTTGHSFAGRHAGGLFIYAVSVMDAYRFARLRWSIGGTTTQPSADA